ncbi:lebercilin isoform X2 [Parambassis ranga]|uniref:Lebercilin isoform X2 n=1 Tax=Parambassis ranga TaxID=210632 RepID=A0A6P7HMF0_9TELE|nr:lebercilin isoform X2 [Parambassis ranga]
MESEDITDQHKDNRDRSRQSLQSTKRDSRASSSQKHKKNFQEKIHNEDEKEDLVESRLKTRTWHSDPDRDQISDDEGRRSQGSFYSEDYENNSPSDRSYSPDSRSRTPSPSPQRGVRAKRIPGSPFHKTGGGGRWGVSRPLRPGQPLTQQQRKGVRSQSKESTPSKDLDLVTKRMLSARLLKINELHNALAELQQRTDELQKENRILKRLQVRQEKALQRYDDTENEISQLLARHSNEIQVYRERLRRTQERERVAERRVKESEEQLRKCKTTAARLKKLVDEQELGDRGELSRRLEGEKARAQEAERKIKDLERSMELSSSSYQRQLVAEKKKTVSAQEEIRTLQEELERLTNKLKEKERELDAKNIYANRMVKPSKRNDADNSTKLPSRNSTKAVQTEDRMSSLDFPTPPPAITDANEYSEQPPDEYLSLKELDRVDQREELLDKPQNHVRKEGETAREQEQEKKKTQLFKQEQNVLEENTKHPVSTGLDKQKGKDNIKGTSPLSNQKDESKRGHVHEEVQRWNQETQANQHAAEEARRKKELLLAKMREIDHQNKKGQDLFFFESRPSEARIGTDDPSSPHPPEQKNTSIFSLTESEELGSSRTGNREGGRRRPGIEGGAVTTGIRRRALRSPISSDDLAFGGYAPSFGNSASRVSSGFSPPPSKEENNSALEAIGVFNLREVDSEKDETEKIGGKDKKSNLMQQLFGVQAIPAGDSVIISNKMEVLNSPPTTNGVHSRRLLSFNSGSSTPPASSVNTLHVADSRPSIRAIPSFDDDIEELTL